MQDSGISESDDGFLCHETSLSRGAFVLGAFSSESCCVIGLNSRQALRALNAINLYPPGEVWFTGSVYDPATAQWTDEGGAGIALPLCLPQGMSSRRGGWLSCRA